VPVIYLRSLSSGGDQSGAYRLDAGAKQKYSRERWRNRAGRKRERLNIPVYFRSPALSFPSFFFPSFARPFLLFRCLSILPSLQPLRESNALESHGSSDLTSLRIRGLPRPHVLRARNDLVPRRDIAIDRPRQGSQECSSRRAESARVIRLRSRCGDLRISRTIESARCAATRFYIVYLFIIPMIHVRSRWRRDTSLTAVMPPRRADIPLIIDRLPSTLRRARARRPTTATRARRPLGRLGLEPILTFPAVVPT